MWWWRGRVIAGHVRLRAQFVVEGFCDQVVEGLGHGLDASLVECRHQGRPFGCNGIAQGCQAGSLSVRELKLQRFGTGRFRCADAGEIGLELANPCDQVVALAGQVRDALLVQGDVAGNLAHQAHAHPPHVAAFEQLPDGGRGRDPVVGPKHEDALASPFADGLLAATEQPRNFRLRQPQVIQARGRQE